MVWWQGYIKEAVHKWSYLYKSILENKKSSISSTIFYAEKGLFLDNSFGVFPIFSGVLVLLIRFIIISATFLNYISESISGRLSIMVWIKQFMSVPARME